MSGVRAKKIGVLGTGVVGQTLASGYVKHGFQVMLSGRGKPNANADEWLSKQNRAPNARTGTFAEAVQFADIVVLAVNGDVVEEALRQAGAPFANKLVIDTTNAIKFVPDFGPAPALGGDTSLGEKVQAIVGGSSHVVKAYNFINNKHMIDPQPIGGSKPTHFVAGESKEAKATVTELLHVTGWDDVVDCGGIISSRTLEPLALLWIKLAFDRNWNPDHAFKLLQTK